MDGFFDEYISTIESLVTSRHPTHGNKAKMFFKMAQKSMMKKLDIHIGGNTVWISHDEAEFQKIGKCSHMIWLGKYNMSS